MLSLTQKTFKLILCVFVAATWNLTFHVTRGPGLPTLKRQP
jgi:hypothetical protein